MIDEQLILSEIRLLRELIEARLPEKKKRKPSSAIGKKKYGEHKHVLMTNEEYDKLADEFGNVATSFLIKILDDYLETSGKTYRNHYKMLREGWPQERLKEWQQASRQSNDKRNLWQ